MNASVAFLSLSGAFGLAGWILSLIALNYRHCAVICQPSLWTVAVTQSGVPGVKLAAAAFTFILSVSAWLPALLAFIGAIKSADSQTRAYSVALAIIFFFNMTLASLYFINVADWHGNGQWALGPSGANPLPDAQMMAAVFMFLPAGIFSLIAFCTAANKPEEGNADKPKQADPCEARISMPECSEVGAHVGQGTEKPKQVNHGETRISMPECSEVGAHVGQGTEAV